MKPSEIRDKDPSELDALEIELREKLLRLRVARVTQRVRNTSQFRTLRKDIARIHTIRSERMRLQGASIDLDTGASET